MIDVTSLSRFYGKTKAVDSVSFSIGERSIVGLLGHNGAGKTTVMKMLSGYLEPSSGSVRIGGRDLETQRRDIQRELGYLPENLPVYPEMTIADYLDYAAGLKGLRDAAGRAAIRRSVEATELGARLADPIGTLSRGFRQRVGVAQAILGEPSLLILDEPGNGLDPEQNEHMRALIRDIAQSATVILSTHIMQEVGALCDRALVLVGGQLALDEDMATLRGGNRLLVRFGGDLGTTRTQLASLPGVDAADTVAADDNRCEVALTLAASASHDDIADAAARAVLDSGARLFAVQRESRDLEQVFRDAVSQRGGRDAA